MEAQKLQEQHLTLKNDYVKAVKQTIAPNYKVEGAPVETKSEADIYREWADAQKGSGK